MRSQRAAGFRFPLKTRVISDMIKAAVISCHLKLAKENAAGLPARTLGTSPLVSAGRENARNPAQSRETSSAWGWGGR